MVYNLILGIFVIVRRIYFILYIFCKIKIDIFKEMIILIDNNSVIEFWVINLVFVLVSKLFNKKKIVFNMDRKYLYIVMLKNVNFDINVIYGDIKR